MWHPTVQRLAEFVGRQHEGAICAWVDQPDRGCGRRAENAMGLVYLGFIRRPPLARLGSKAGAGLNLTWCDAF